MLRTISIVAILPMLAYAQQNTALGFGALASPSGQLSDTAIGYEVLASQTSGDLNTGVGALALVYNSSGSGNTAIGYFALTNNSTANYNTATGYAALHANTTGAYNTAYGANSLLQSSIGTYNVGLGASSLSNNTSGVLNTALGSLALTNNQTGSQNIAVGWAAAYSVGPGNSSNIHIGSEGSSGDNNLIRIGYGQTAFFGAGIRGVTTGAPNAVPVMIDSNGQLGTVSSSIRFKEDIHDMGDRSSGLLRLRPVTYRYKKAYADGSKPEDYGLIAEEVAKVYPDLVVMGADGQAETVQYQKLTPMLLNEVQKQAATIEKLEARLAALEAGATAQRP